MIFLHAFGTRYYLPAPLFLYLIGAGAVVFVSFLLVLPRRVHREESALIDIAPASAGVSWPGWVLGAIACLLVAAGIWGSQVPGENILPTAFWLVFWVACPISIAIIGNYWPYISPLNVIAWTAGRRARTQYPRSWGFWPAVVLLFVFGSLELIFNAFTTLPIVTAFIMVGYAVLTAVMAAMFGAEAWIQRGELFSVLFATWGRLGWFRFKSPGRNGFLGGLVHPFEPGPDRLAFVLLMLISVSFDGLLATPAWKSAKLALPGILKATSAYDALLVIVFVLLGAFIWSLFFSFAAAVRAVGRLEGSSMAVLAGLLPSLVPISFGYLLAHNLDYLSINGQLLLPLLSDPTGSGYLNLFGGADYEVNKDLLPTVVIWYWEIALIIAVHVAAVILAHRYASQKARTIVLGRRAEWPWIGAMVSYTMSSLWLLAQPLVH
ncbi:MAG TPA: hypothetical protein VKK81_00120 [Candidatus Binatia bacterium]|nr:hypothetical protein [Candidatus Binatia bacterium]